MGRVTKESNNNQRAQKRNTQLKNRNENIRKNSSNTKNPVCERLNLKRY